MQNYEQVAMWTATLNVDSAVKELRALKVKYPWLRCDDSLVALEKLSSDLPKVVEIIKHQEKQNAFHRKYIEVNKLADTAIVEALIAKFKIDL